MTLLDWLGRVTLLILAGLATLSIIASVAAVSHIRIAGEDAPAASIEVAAPELPERRATGAARTDARSGMAASPHADSPDAVIVQVPPLTDSPARWLEALTYAVLALAGFAAAAVIVLLRITALLARIAGR